MSRAVDSSELDVLDAALASRLRDRLTVLGEVAERARLIEFTDPADRPDPIAMLQFVEQSDLSADELRVYQLQAAAALVVRLTGSGS